jgi:capsular exopolysaccharide synthesis family protein
MADNINNQDKSSDLPFNVKDFIFLLRINYLKILFFVFFGFLISLYYTLSVPPEFRANTSIMIREKQGASMIMDFGGTRHRNQILNEIQLIKSRQISEAVIEELWNTGYKNKMYLFGSRVFKPRGQSIRRLTKELFSLGFYDPQSEMPKRYNEVYSKKIGEKFAGKIQRNLKVVARRDTDILELSYASLNSEESMKIVNTIASVYLNLDKKWTSDQANNIVQFLDSQIKLQSIKLSDSEERLKSFKENERIYDLEGNSNMVLEKLIEAETIYNNTLAEININNEKYDYLKSTLSEDEKSLASQLLSGMNLQVNSLRVTIAELESKLVRNIAQYGEFHEAVQNTQKKINLLKNQLKNKTNNLIAQGFSVSDPLKHRQNLISEMIGIQLIKSSFDTKSLEYKKLVDGYNKELDNLPGKQLSFARLDREYSVLSKNYIFMLQKFEEAKINVASEVGKVQIVDIALKPFRPIKPDHSRNLFLGIIAGLIIGIGMIMVFDYFDNTVKSADDIEAKNLTVLGIIPSIGDESINTNPLYFWKSKNSTKSASASRKLKRKLITRENPKSPVSEAYRSLRTSMMYSSADKKIKSILVSSSGPGEGKTTTVANLAITFANLGKKTLLIDTDLRRPVIHKIFGVDRDTGITTYLSGLNEDFNSLIQPTSVDNLHVVSSGFIPPNPSELLGSEKMAKLVSQLEKDWDMVLFDSPPLVAVTDATMVSKEIDQIVIVVKAGHTDKTAFNHTVNSLTNVNAPLGGVILNAVTSKNSYGSYYYYYQYYHYYGNYASDTESEVS